MTSFDSSQVNIHTGQTGALSMVLAENERTKIRQRQAEGIAAAKANGMKFGRPVIKAPPNFPEIVQKWENGIIKSYEAAEMCGMCESTFYHRLREYRATLNSEK